MGVSAAGVVSGMFRRSGRKPVRPWHVPQIPVIWSEGVCVIAVGERQAFCPGAGRHLGQLEIYN